MSSLEGGTPDRNEVQVSQLWPKEQSTGHRQGMKPAVHSEELLWQEHQTVDVRYTAFHLSCHTCFYTVLRNANFTASVLTVSLGFVWIPYRQSNTHRPKGNPLTPPVSMSNYQQALPLLPPKYTQTPLTSLQVHPSISPNLNHHCPLSGLTQ